MICLMMTAGARRAAMYYATNNIEAFGTLQSWLPKVYNTANGR
jgi:hypothetical protein